MTSDRSPAVSLTNSDEANEFPWAAAKWSSRVSAGLRTSAKNRDTAAFCRGWLAEILPKATVKTPQGLCLWSLHGGRTDDEIARLTRQAFAATSDPNGVGHKSSIRVRRTPAEHLAALAAALTKKPLRWTPTETVTAGEALLCGGQRLPVSQVWGLWSRLAGEGVQPASVPDEETPDNFLLRSGEIPFLSGLLLEPLRDAKPLREQGRRVLAAELLSRTDGDGSPHAELLSRLPLWLAPFIRATLWAERFQTELWTDEERRRLSLVLERSIPLCRPNGLLALSNGHAIPALPLFEAAAKTLSLTGPAEKLLRVLKTHPKPSAVRKRPAGDVQIMPSVQSDWACFAMLRSDWSTHADSLAIAHHQPVPQLDVAALGRAVLHGGWGFALQIGDAMIEPASEWSCSCWASDPDADYLELQMQGPGGLRVERQILLSRQDHFLLLADSIRGAKSVTKSLAGSSDEHRIHLKSALPLAEGVTAEADRLSREIRLKAGKLTVRVFPLALADDRVQSSPHEFSLDGQNLVLRQIGVGNGLYAPLLFDWHPARTRQPALWRTLTVTEAGKVVGRDIAAGHRLQLGKFQLLTYRGLAAAAAARAVLGHHTWHESVIARVDRHGDVDPIMKVES